MDWSNASDISHMVWYWHVLRPRQIKQLFIFINEPDHVIAEPFTKVWGISCIVFHISPTTPANYYQTVTMEMSSASHKWWCTLIGERMDFSKLNKGSGTRCSWPDSLRGVSLNLRAPNYFKWMYLFNFTCNKPHLNFPKCSHLWQIQQEGPIQSKGWNKQDIKWSIQLFKKKA